MGRNIKLNEKLKETSLLTLNTICRYKLLNMSIYQDRLDKVNDFLTERSLSKKEQPLTRREIKDLIKQLNGILMDIKKECLPYYEIKELTREINDQVHGMNEFNREEIVNKVKKLLPRIESLDTTDESKKRIIDEACEAIYQVILEESMLEKYEIMYTLKNYKLTNDKINLLVQRDFSNYSKNTFNSDCLYNGDIIYEHMIDKMASLTLNKKKEEYLKRKNNATMELLNQKDELLKEKADLDNEAKEVKTVVKNLRINMNSARLKFASLILVPTILIVTPTYFIGKAFKKTRIDSKTYSYINKEKKLVDTNSEYKRQLQLRKGTVKICGNWKESPTGEGYLREVTEFGVDLDNLDDDIYTKAIEATENPKSYIEVNVDPNSNLDLENPEVIIIESIRDDSDYQEEPLAYIITAPAIAFLVLLFTAMLELGDIFYLEALSNCIDDIKENKKYLKGEFNLKVIKERYEQIGDKIVKLQEEYQSHGINYEELADRIPEEVIVEAKKYIKK